MNLSDKDLDIIWARAELGNRVSPKDVASIAHELKSLRASQAKVVEALKPFAEEAQFYEDDADDFDLTMDLNVGMLRKAARALAEHRGQT